MIPYVKPPEEDKSDAPRREVIDYVLFRLPKDRELQFPAMAVVQQFVNEYFEKMKYNATGGPGVVFKLEYDIEIDPVSWQFFKAIELKLNQEPSGLVDHYDMLGDFTEEHLEQFKSLNRHACYVCGAFLGVLRNPLPDIRRIKARTAPPYVYGIVDATLLPYIENSATRAAHLMTVDDLMNLRPETCTCVVGWQSWITYWAASMGLPVIEVLQPGRSSTWLSKWSNIGYRLVDSTENMGPQIEAAMASLERLCLREVARDVERSMLTVPGTSIATVVKGLSRPRTKG